MPWEAETTANSDVFEGQVAKNTVIYGVVLTQRPKTGVCARFLATGRHKTLVFTKVLAFFEDSRQTSTKDKNTVKKQCFWLETNPKMSPTTSPKSQKKSFRATPHQRVEKNTLQTQKMNPKSWKTRGFFTFFWSRFGGRVHEQVYSVLFFTVFCEGERHDLSKTGGFFQKKLPPPGKPEP